MGTKWFLLLFRGMEAIIREAAILLSFDLTVISKQVTAYLHDPRKQRKTKVNAPLYHLTKSNLLGDSDDMNEDA
jgi:hypothetical protein